MVPYMPDNDPNAPVRQGYDKTDFSGGAGPVDAPDTLGKMLGAEAFQKMRETKGAEDGLIKPDEVAETYWHLSQQHRSAWTHELDLRPFSCMPWWNH